MRETATNIGPEDTKKTYAYTSEQRQQQKLKVYSVNIPFAKYPTASAEKPASAVHSEAATNMKLNSHSASPMSKSYTASSSLGQPWRNNSVTGGQNLESEQQRKQNKESMSQSHVKMKFPENSPYNSGKANTEFKPNQNRKELLINAKRAEFQGQLRNSSLKFTLDEKNNLVSYNNCAGGGGKDDMIYSVKSSKPEPLAAELFDKQSKNHLTQMATTGNRTVRNGSFQAPTSDARFMTITDSYFNRARQTHNTLGDAELLKDHYKFHKGTTYSIGNEKDCAASLTLAQETYVAKQREENADVLPGRRN